MTLAGRVGIPEAAKQLGIESQLIYNWRNCRGQVQFLCVVREGGAQVQGNDELKAHFAGVTEPVESGFPGGPPERERGGRYHLALWRRKKPTGVIVHSDRGSQYCSHDYQKLLRDHELICSMSKKGDCYDNAAMEGWNHSLNVEAIHGEKIPTRADAKNHVFEHIDVYYNRKRLHSKLGYLSPEAFEASKVA